MPKRKLYFIVAITLVLLVMAFLLRGGPAVSGILWGTRLSLPRVCNIELSVLEPLCHSQKSNLTVNLGAYDPSGQFMHTPLAIDHYFIQWTNTDTTSLLADVTASHQNGRWPMITVEPWPSNQNGHTTQTLFKDIQSGVYNKPIDTICGTIGASGQPALIRWGHEMDHITGRYPWASADSQGYIASYRYFVTRCRHVASKTYYVWSPAGDKNLSAYWPGGSYADYVGVSVYSFPAYDKQNYGVIRDFNATFSEKYDRVKGYGKPIMIAELGVTGSQTHQWFWMQNAFASFARYQKLKTVVYFDAVDSPAAWGSQYPVPDWRIDPSVFEKH